MDALAWMAIVLGCVSAIDDLRRRVISNWVNVAALTGGLAYHLVRQGLTGLAMAAAGAAIGFAVFLVCYCLGGMGGGDIKLMAAFGALLGPSGVLTAALLSAIIGGLLAMAFLAFDRRRQSIPYAPAIVLGSWLALWARS